MFRKKTRKKFCGQFFERELEKNYFWAILSEKFKRIFTGQFFEFFPRQCLKRKTGKKILWTIFREKTGEKKSFLGDFRRENQTNLYWAIFRIFFQDNF